MNIYIYIFQLRRSHSELPTPPIQSHPIPAQPVCVCECTIKNKRMQRCTATPSYHAHLVERVDPRDGAVGRRRPADRLAAPTFLDQQPSPVQRHPVVVGRHGRCRRGPRAAHLQRHDECLCDDDCPSPAAGPARDAGQEAADAGDHCRSRCR